MSSSELLDELRRWLRFAREDLEAAETLLAEKGSVPGTSAGLPNKRQKRVSRSLGPGEKSVLTWALSAGPEALCVLDDAAARTEARRLSLAVTGTLGLVLRAKLAGKLAAAAPLLEEAVAAGLYLDDAVLTAALAGVGELWPRRS